jgi:uncharacterized membrane-anchored protein YhcB (DUF1043 family)
MACLEPLGLSEAEFEQATLNCFRRSLQNHFSVSAMLLAELLRNCLYADIILSDRLRDASSDHPKIPAEAQKKSLKKL